MKIPFNHIKLGIWLLISVVILGFVLIKFVVHTALIEGNSMLPTYHSNQYVIINKARLWWHNPVKGEVVLVRDPQDGKMDIKRIAGVPHDTVIFVLHGQTNHVTLLDNQYFVLGDNAEVSYDSRFYGYLTRDQLIGLATVIP